MEHAPPSWVLEARSLPIAFAQVREDPLIDLWVARQLKDNARVVMIASGGCTAALLACSRNIGRLHLVDPNPAQLALSLLKLRLLQAHDRPTRLALLGHAPLDPRIRRARIESELGHLGLDAGSLGPANLVATLGPDHAGRYERVFAALRHALADVADDLAALLQLGDPLEQRRRVAPSTRLGRVVDDALDELEVGVACMGTIEFAFAGISAAIGKSVVDRGWIPAERLVHYKLHAEIDERHAEEFFAVIEPSWDDPRRRYYIEQGLELGAYIFDRLYRDMHDMGTMTHDAARSAA